MLPRGAAVSYNTDVGHCASGRGISPAPMDFPKDKGSLTGSRSDPFGGDDCDCSSGLLYRTASGARSSQRGRANPGKPDTGELGEVPEGAPAPGTNCGPDRTGSEPARDAAAGGGRREWRSAFGGERFGARSRATVHRVLFW